MGLEDLRFDRKVGTEIMRPSSFHFMSRSVIIGLGELLWDCLPEGRKLGGAPANFAYHANILGNTGIVATRIGQDELGNEAVSILEHAGLDTSYIQRDPEHKTGTVDVTVDEKGHADYIFSSDAAWDHMELTPQWQALAQKADAVCFGSLGQRSPDSRSAILSFLQTVPSTTLRVFDVNLRQNFYNAEILEKSLFYCDILKLNEQELPMLAELLNFPWEGEKETLERIRHRFKLTLMCYTRSDKGSYFVSATECCDHPGYRVNVADTIGAGDAFTASVVHHYLQKRPLGEIAEAASRRGAWVATQAGAMPDPASFDEVSLVSSSRR
jgi:fructokinase